MDLVHIALGLTTAVLAALFVERAILYYRKHLRAETVRMEVAAEALRKHREAVAALLDNKDADRRLVSLVLAMSESVTSQEAGRELVAFLADLAEGKVARDPSPEHDEIFETAYVNATVRAQFGSAVRHGLVAMTMQWHDTSRQIRALAEIATDDAHQVVRAAASIRRPIGGGLAGMQPAFAPA